MKLEFKPLDFSRAELQRKFGDDAEWFYNRLAQIANDRLAEMLAKAPLVYGRGSGSDSTQWWGYSWEGEDTHTARIVDKKELQK